jgi:hypothetical protein
VADPHFHGVSAEDVAGQHVRAPAGPRTVPPGPGALLAGGIEGLLGFGEGVAGGVERGLDPLHGGVGLR